jgi:MFS family permease
LSPRAAITIVFALNGALFGSLYSRMPALRDNLSLSNGELGLALLAITVALVLAAIPAGALIARFGARAVVIAGALIAIAALPLAALASSLVVFAAALALYGAGAALVDVAMNVKGMETEEASDKRIFGSLHAGFSFGSLVGVLLGAAAAGAGLAPFGQFLITAGLAVMTLGLVTHALGPDRAGRKTARQPLFARPTRALYLVGLVAFCVLLAEGSISDWGAIFLHDEHHSSQAVAAIGLGAFSLTMTAGRLAVDPLSERFGSQALIRVGGATAAAVVGAMLIAPSALASIGALLVLGLAISPLFPMTLRAAGSAGPAMAFAAGSGYTGLLTGPPVIGGLAELFSLRLALLLVVACCLLGTVLAPRGAAD